MITNKIVTLLNNKINDELYRSNQFLDISGWAADLSLKGIEGYFVHLSQKALQNSHAIIEYVNQTGNQVQLGSIAEGLREFDNIEDVFVYLKELDAGYKANLNNLLDECLSSKDFATFANFEEQVKSLHTDEFFVKSILDKIKIVGSKGHGLYLIDKDLAEEYPLPVIQ